MRITSNIFYDHISQGLMENLKELDSLSTKISTGKKINKPSDDILGTLKTLDYKLTISQNNQGQQNIIAANNYLNFASTVLTQVSSSISNLKKTILKTDGTSQDQTYYSQLVATLRDSLLDLSNSIYLNTYVFSGTLSDQESYSYDAATHSYLYQGNNQQVSISIGPGNTLNSLNIVGSSPNSTTITPFGYTLAAADTVNLPSGSSAVLTPDILTNPNATTVNVAITDSQANVDNFSFSNVIDVANLISHAWAQEDVDGTALTGSQAQDRLETLSGVLDQFQNQLLTVQGQIGINQAQLNDQKIKLTSNTTAQQNNISNIMDADMDETIVSLQKISTNLNALRAASSKILSQSLFDFLQ
jgi:flagellar hook-associated protein 3 FlgL